MSGIINSNESFRYIKKKMDGLGTRTLQRELTKLNAKNYKEYLEHKKVSTERFVSEDIDRMNEIKREIKKIGTRRLIEGLEKNAAENKFKINMADSEIKHFEKHIDKIKFACRQLTYSYEMQKEAICALKRKNSNKFPITFDELKVDTKYYSNYLNSEIVVVGMCNYKNRPSVFYTKYDSMYRSELPFKQLELETLPKEESD